MKADLAILVVDVLTETTNYCSVNEERPHHNNGLQHLSQGHLSDKYREKECPLEHTGKGTSWTTPVREHQDTSRLRAVEGGFPSYPFCPLPVWEVEHIVQIQCRC